VLLARGGLGGEEAFRAAAADQRSELQET